MTGNVKNDDPSGGILAGAMPVLISYVDAEQRFRFNNSAFETWFDRSIESLEGQHLRDFFGVTTYAQLLPYVQAALSGRHTTFELTLRKHGGESVATQFILMPQAGDDGTIIGFYSLVTDLTVIVRSQDALSDSEALYHSLVDQLPMCLLRKDLEGRFTIANAQFLRFSGKAADEVIGRTDFDLFPEELARKYQQDDQRVIATGEVLDTVESHRAREQGELRHVQILKTPVFDSSGTVVGIQVLFWDVTEKYAAETSLNESTALIRAIFDSALDCIVLVDQDGVILDLNRSTVRVFGYESEELIGRSLNETLVPPSDSGTRVENRDWFDVMRSQPIEEENGHIVGRRVEMSAQHRDGRIFDVEMAMQPIPYEGRTVFAMFLHDITERKRAAEEIEAKNKDLETLLYVTSHDLREPLRAIRSFTQLLSDRARDRLNDVEQGYLARVVDGADRLNRLLEDVLMMSRAKRANEGTQLIDSTIIARDIIRQFDVRITETGGLVEIVGELPWIRVDPRWLRQSLFNLVGNSLKFQKGDEPPHVEIAAYEPELENTGVTGLVVRDRGPGIANEHVERVFQLFQRAVGRKIEGTGAGLAIVRQISTRYGGDAWYEPRPGGGSQFFITFRT